MEGLVKLEWNLKCDRNAREYVYGVNDEYGLKSLRTLAMLLKQSGICGSIRIVDFNGSLVEDWTKGYKRYSVDIFNEQLAEVLECPGGPHEREEALKEEVRVLRSKRC